MCAYVGRDGGVEGQAMCYCVGASVCGKLGVCVEGEMDIVEETHMCAERQLWVC